jgi:hypothetical protein
VRGNFALRSFHSAQDDSSAVGRSQDRVPFCGARIFQAGNLSQDGGGLVLQGRFQRLIVYIGYLARFVLEVEIAQVFVDGIFALAQIAGAGFLRTEKEFSGHVKDVNIQEMRQSDPSRKQQMSQIIDQSPCGPGRGTVRARQSFPACSKPLRAGPGGGPFPSAGNQHNQAEAENRAAKGTTYAARSKPFAGWSREHGWSVFLDEALLDQAVAVSASHRCQEFVAHAVGRRAANVVAFQKNLVAAADAHHLVADFVEACGGVSGADQSEDRGAEQKGLRELATGSGRLRFRIRVCHRPLA